MEYIWLSAPDSTTDYAATILTFSSKHGVTSYSGSYYQPQFANGGKTHDYGNVTCKRFTQTVSDK